MNCNDLWRRLPPITVPGQLTFRIIRKIDACRQRQARIRLACLGSLSLLSFVAIFPALAYFYRLAAASGFGQYATLALSDWTVLTVAWKEFLLSLAESLPYLALTASLTAILAFIWSGLAALREARSAFFTKLI